MGTTVAMDDILEALELASDETSSYVNSRTGVVLTLSHEELRLAEEDSGSEMPDWQREMVAQAKQLLESDEWLELPSNQNNAGIYGSVTRIGRLAVGQAIVLHAAAEKREPK